MPEDGQLARGLTCAKRLVQRSFPCVRVRFEPQMDGCMRPDVLRKTHEKQHRVKNEHETPVRVPQVMDISMLARLSKSVLVEIRRSMLPLVAASLG